MGRHGQPRRRRAPAGPGPGELLGWGAFAAVVAAVAVRWYGGSWTTVGLVCGGAGLALAAVTVMAVRGAARPGRRRRAP